MAIFYGDIAICGADAGSGEEISVLTYSEYKKAVAEHRTNQDIIYMTIADPESAIVEYIPDYYTNSYFNGKKEQLSVEYISRDAYHSKLESHSIENGKVYLISSDYYKLYNHRLENVGEPDISSDAATKNYVDKHSGTKVSISEDGGKTFISASEVKLINISENEYNELVKSGNVLSNAIYEVDYENSNCFGKKLINVGSPVDDSDAATKNYVDVLTTAVETAANNTVSNISAKTLLSASQQTDLKIIDLSTDLILAFTNRLSTYINENCVGYPDFENSYPTLSTETAKDISAYFPNTKSYLFGEGETEFKQGGNQHAYTASNNGWLEIYVEPNNDFSILLNNADVLKCKNGKSTGLWTPIKKNQFISFNAENEITINDGTYIRMTFYPQVFANITI